MPHHHHDRDHHSCLMVIPECYHPSRHEWGGMACGCYSDGGSDKWGPIGDEGESIIGGGNGRSDGVSHGSTMDDAGIDCCRLGSKKVGL